MFERAKSFSASKRLIRWYKASCIKNVNNNTAQGWKFSLGSDNAVHSEKLSEIEMKI
jgi:hypothetical protein